MAAKASRKRAAPGASPSQPLGTPANYPSQHSPDQYLQWDQSHKSTDAGAYQDSFGSNLYTTLANQAMPQETSNQLTRRPVNPMVPRAAYNNGGNDAWGGGMIDGMPQQTEFTWMQSTDEEKLDEEAREAMESAKKSRKSIPPFVQKLRSFLDESRNTELIRWSPDGDSFIVLDEEEFARTLIPELFKHANYASFVRQLNMYGFHKQVGLSDNSMRASERKNKSPSEYKNPYFRRGKQNWMWLIQKPKSAQSKGKGRGKHEDGNDEDELYDGESSTFPGPAVDEKPAGLRGLRPPLMIGQGDNSNAMAREELAAIHQELRLVRQQHQAIAEIIQRMQREQNQVMTQAKVFTDQHNRHENSINAILTFLATVYERSLEGNPNIGQMFAPQNLTQQGSVVDVGDLGDAGIGSTAVPQRRQLRRQPLLLKAPPSNTSEPNLISTPPAASIPSINDVYSFSRGPGSTSRHSAIEEIPDQDFPTTPQSVGQQMNNQFQSTSSPSNTGMQVPDRDIMSLINSTNANDANASSGNQMDFGQALSHLQNSNGKGPLSASERNGMLQMMSNGNNNGLTNGNNSNAVASNAPMSMPATGTQNWQAANNDFAMVQKTLEDADQRIHNLSNRLSPISPDGGIPGFNERNYIAPPVNDGLTFDQIFNSDYFNDVNSGNIDFGNDATADFDNGNFSFDDDPLGTNPGKPYASIERDDQGGRVLETVDSSEATSPANTVEESVLDDAQSPRKKRRT